MSTALALPDQPLAEQWKYAQALAQAGLLPKQYRESPGDVLLAMAYADALHLPVAQVFTGIHVIEGRPSMSAELMGALVRRAGHRIRMNGDKQSAAAEIVRRDDPDFTYRASFTLDDARQAGLLGKDVWKKYPAAMLLARAVSAVCRAGAADVLAGVSYVPEELGEAPEWIDEVVRLPALSTAEESAAPAAQEAVDPLPDDAPPSDPPKRKRRTRAEMDAARQASASESSKIAEKILGNLPEADLAGPSDPAGEAAQEISVAEAQEEQWVADWQVDLEQAVQDSDLAAIGVLGSKASAGGRADLVRDARLAWNDVHAQASAG